MVKVGEHITLDILGATKEHTSSFYEKIIYKIAKAAKVGHLVFYHLTPAPRNTIMERVFTRGVEEIFPENWTMAKDGLLVSLPTGTDDINISYLD